MSESHTTANGGDEAAQLLAEEMSAQPHMKSEEVQYEYLMKELGVHEVCSSFTTKFIFKNEKEISQLTCQEEVLVADAGDADQHETTVAVEVAPTSDEAKKEEAASTEGAPKPEEGLKPEAGATGEAVAGMCDVLCVIFVAYARCWIG